MYLPAVGPGHQSSLSKTDFQKQFTSLATGTHLLLVGPSSSSYFSSSVIILQKVIVTFPIPSLH